MPGLDPESLVFVDETWASTAMTRARGRCASGKRLVMPVPHGHWKTTTFLAALRGDGLTAPTVVDGAINGELFEAYVRQQLVPVLGAGDVVVMDNLSSHKTAEVARLIAEAEAEVRYLPAYSPDLNPIENDQTDPTSSDRWCEATDPGYHRPRPAARAGQVVQAVPG